MDDGAALLRGICEEPGDDTARLVYADYLDERGEAARAEFIRLQILLHNTSFIRQGGRHSKWPEPWASRIRRADELANQYAREWAGALADQWPHDRFMFEDAYRRGFLERARFASGRFLSDAARVFGEHPVVQVTLSGRGPRRAGPSETGNWFWRRVVEPHERYLPDEVPAVIFDRLDQPAAGYTGAYRANDALSAVLVAYGRELAGLSPLSNSPSIASHTSRPGTG